MKIKIAVVWRLAYDAPKTRYQINDYDIVKKRKVIEVKSYIAQG